VKTIRTALVIITRWFLKALFFFGLFFTSVAFPIPFGIVTFFLSLFIFSRLEHDKKTHERTFYFIEEPSKIFSAFLIYENSHNFRTNKPDEWKTANEILFETMDYWKEQGKPMIVILL